MKTPAVAMWGLSIQQEIAKNTVFTITYIGNHGTSLYGGYDTNQSNITSNGFLQAFQQVQANQDSPLMTQIISKDTRRLAGETARVLGDDLRHQRAVLVSLHLLERLQKTVRRNVALVGVIATVQARTVIADVSDGEHRILRDLLLDTEPPHGDSGRLH